MSTDKKKTLLDLMDEAAPLEAGVVAWDDRGPAGGYTMSQANVADAMGLSVRVVSVLIAHFELNQDSAFAVKVRRGDGEVVQFRRAVIEALRERVRATSPKVMPSHLRWHLERAAKQIA